MQVSITWNLIAYIERFFWREYVFIHRSDTEQEEVTLASHRANWLSFIYDNYALYTSMSPACKKSDIDTTIWYRQNKFTIHQLANTAAQNRKL